MIMADFGSPRPSIGDALYADVQHYVSLSPHRTGTSGDHATAQWLQSRLSHLAWRTTLVRAAVDPFFDYHGCEVRVSSDNFECFGVWLPNSTCIGGGLPIKLANGAPNFVERHVAVVEVSSATLKGGAGAAIQAAINRGAAAVLVINGAGDLGDGPAPEHRDPTALNAPAPYRSAVWSVPVLLVGGSARSAHGVLGTLTSP